MAFVLCTSSFDTRFKSTAGRGGENMAFVLYASSLDTRLMGASR